MVAFSNEEQWAIDGSPLSTWAYNIESIGGRQGIPPMMGENFHVPFRRGDVWRSKLPASRVLSLGMWIRSTDAEGVTPKTAIGRRAQFNENLRQLRNIFYNSGRLLNLTKNVRYLTGVQAFSTKVECISTLDPQMSGPNFGKMVIDLRMPDPFWTTGPVTLNGLGHNIFSGHTVSVLGDDSTYKITMVIRNNGSGAAFPGGGNWGTGTTILRNITYSPPIAFVVPTPVPGVPWNVDVENFFLGQSGDTTVNRQNQIQARSGSPFWFELKKGDNNIIIDSRFGQGSANPIAVDFTYFPVYL